MTKKNNQLLMLLSAVGLMAFTACADDKYDLSDIDMTIGVGSDDGLTLPTSSTRQIFLKDLLELDNTQSVILNADDDYVFLQEGSEIDEVGVSIGEIPVTDSGSLDLPFDIGKEISLPSDLSSLMGQKLPNTSGSIEKDIYTMRYVGDKPDEINSLMNVDTEGSFNIVIGFPENLSKFISTFTTFQLEFPQYMEVELPQEFTDKYEVSGSKLKAKNGVSTNSNLIIGINIKKLFVDGEGLKIDDGSKIVMEGSVKMSLAWDDIVVGGSEFNGLFSNALSIDGLVITGATGSFSPKIEMTNLGDVEIGELPDFLTGENVKVDLYNPQIVINIKSDLSVPGYLKGKLTAHKKDGNEVSVDIEKVKINAVEENEGISNIMICRQEMDFSEYTDYQVVPKLSEIIEVLPYTNTISFDVEAGAEHSREDSKIKLGNEYKIAPSYRIEAPIAFGPNARIAYTDTLDGWNDDIKDLELANEAYVEVTAEIENRIPAYLTMAARAIGVDGKEINDVTVTVQGNIAASEDGSTPKTSPIIVTIKQNGKNGLKALDGIIFSIEAASSDGNKSIEGITLNAKKHSMLAKNIKAKIMGKVIIKGDD